MMDRRDPIEMLKAVGADVPFLDDAGVAAAREAFVARLTEKQVTAPSQPARVPTRRFPKRTRIAIALLVVFVVVCATAVAAVLSSLPASTVDTTKTLGELSSVQDLEIFKRPSRAPLRGADREQLSKLAASAGRESPLAGLDLLTARSAAVPASGDHVWLVQTRSGELCM